MLAYQEKRQDPYSTELQNFNEECSVKFPGTFPWQFRSGSVTFAAVKMAPGKLATFLSRWTEKHYMHLFFCSKDALRSGSWGSGGRCGIGSCHEATRELHLPGWPGSSYHLLLRFLQRTRKGIVNVSSMYAIVWSAETHCALQLIFSNIFKFKWEHCQLSEVTHIFKKRI